MILHSKQKYKIHQQEKFLLVSISPLFEMFWKFMNTDKMFEVQDLHLVLLSFRVHPADNRGHVPEDGSVHQGSNEHDQDGEDFLLPRVPRHIPEPYGGEWRAGEVEGGGVGVQVGDLGLVLKPVEVGQLLHPANVLTSVLVPTNHNPDAGQPMGDQDKTGHQKTQYNCAVLVKPS